MRTWIRAKRVRLCGGCGHEINIGAPLLEIQSSAMRRPVIRGTCCAEEEPPADLPAVVVPPSRPPLDMTPLGLLALDYSRRQSTREPGEEG